MVHLELITNLNHFALFLFTGLLKLDMLNLFSYNPSVLSGANGHSIKEIAPNPVGIAQLANRGVSRDIQST